MALACTNGKQVLQSRVVLEPLTGNSNSASHSMHSSAEGNASVRAKCATGTAGRNLQRERERREVKQ